MKVILVTMKVVLDSNEDNAETTISELIRMHYFLEKSFNEKITY